MLRVVLDTNVLISAILTDGKPRTLLRKGISKEFRIVISDLILRELYTVLRRPKFKIDEDENHRIILALMQPKFRFLSAHPGNLIQPIEEWDKAAKESSKEKGV